MEVRILYSTLSLAYSLAWLAIPLYGEPRVHGPLGLEGHFTLMNSELARVLFWKRYSTSDAKRAANIDNGTSPIHFTELLHLIAVPIYTFTASLR